MQDSFWEKDVHAQKEANKLANEFCIEYNIDKTSDNITTSDCLVVNGKYSFWCLQ